MRSVLKLSLLPALVASAPYYSIAQVDKDAAPLISSTEAQIIPDSYMVVFKDHVTKESAPDHHSWVRSIHTESKDGRMQQGVYNPFSTIYGGLKHTYSIANSLVGYSGHFNQDVLEQIRRHPDIAYVEKDSIVHTMSESSLEKNAPWGLARISHREELGFGNFNKYLYASDAGEGVNVYVIDTGTNVKHVDFEGRAHWGKTIPTGDEDEDGNGHGTHCSGTVAGKKFGVAKKANVTAIKVLRSNGSGSMSDVVKGVEYAAEDHEQAMTAAKSGKGKKGFKGSTANMSLGGGKSTVLDKAVNAAVDAGIHFAVAAGNDNADSCKYSPAAAEKAVTVGASTLADERAFFSNYGPCNDIFAPGLDIQSTWIGSDTAVNTISGTSMASPHIAGLLAYLLSLQPAKDSAYAVAEISPKKLKADLLAIATEGALTDVPSNTANILAWNGGGSTNYSEIVAAGRSTIVTSAEPLDDLVQELGKAKEFVHEISSKFENLVEEQLERLQDL